MATKQASRNQPFIVRYYSTISRCVIFFLRTQEYNRARVEHDCYDEIPPIDVPVEEKSNSEHEDNREYSGHSVRVKPELLLHTWFSLQGTDECSVEIIGSPTFWAAIKKLPWQYLTEVESPR